MSGVERAVLVHGGAVDPRAWTPSIDRMGSTWEVVAELRPSVEEVVASLGTPAVLVGASMGGGIALEAAIERPSAVRRLVLIGPLVPSAPTGADRVRMQHLLDAAAQGPGAFTDAALADRWYAAGVTEPVVRRLLRPMLEDNAPGQPGRAGWSPPNPAVEQLAELWVPTTVLVGACDDPSNRAMSAWLAATMPAATLRIVPGSGHLVELARPDEVVAAIGHEPLTAIGDEPLG